MMKFTKHPGGGWRFEVRGDLQGLIAFAAVAILACLLIVTLVVTMRMLLMLAAMITGAELEGW